MRHWQGVALLAGGLTVAVFGGRTPAAAQTTPETASPEEQAAGRIPIEAQADALEFDRTTGVIIGTGNVVIRYGDVTLRADRVRADRDTGDCLAEGNVELRRGEDVWTGNELRYNFLTGKVEGGAYSAFQDPWYVRGAKASRVEKGYWELADAAITTCDLPHPHYFLRAKKLEIYPGDRIVAHNVQFVVGDRAVFWLPMARWSLKEGQSKLQLVPGYSSDFGGYLLGSYGGPLAEWGDYRFHLDYRQKRGFGTGLDLGYRTGPGKGLFQGYYVRDQDRFDEEDVGKDIPKDRYQLRLDHSQPFSGQAYGLLNLTKLSDIDFREDFFEKEYRDSIQPDNIASLTYFSDYYTLTALFHPKLNDFYRVREQIPDVSFDIRRIRLGNTPVYYDSTSRGTYFRENFADTEDVDNYDTVRLDTFHDLSLPAKLGGWLTVVPRLGLRLTYYNKGLRREEIEPVPDPDNPEAVGEVDKIVVLRETGNEARYVVSPGLESSFKAFRVWRSVYSERWGIEGLRHVVQPFMNWTYIPEPNVTPDELAPFDEIDEIDKTDVIRLGLRNKLQTKRRGTSYDLADLILATDYRVEREGDEEVFGDLLGDLEIRLLDRFWVDMDTRIDMYEPRVNEFNTDLRAFSDTDWDVRFGYRYRYDDFNVFSTDLRYTFNAQWAARAYLRYEAEQSLLEEQEYTIYRDLHCWTSAVTFRVRSPLDRDDEYQVWVVLALKAFPFNPVRIGR